MLNLYSIFKNIQIMHDAAGIMHNLLTLSCQMLPTGLGQVGQHFTTDGQQIHMMLNKVSGLIRFVISRSEMQ